MIRPTHHYIGRCKVCGAIHSSVYDMVDNAKTTAKCVADMIADGMNVERVLLGSVELAMDGCDCASNPVKGLPLFALEVTP